MHSYVFVAPGARFQPREISGVQSSAGASSVEPGASGLEVTSLPQAPRPSTTIVTTAPFIMGGTIRASVAAVQMLVDLYKAGQIPNLIIGNSGATSTSDGLPSGNYATILDGPWMAGIWKDQYPDFTPIYAPIPAGKGGSISVVGGEDIVLTAASKNQDAALDFIRFTQSEQFQVEMVKTGQMTVIPAYADQQTAIAPYYATYAEQLKTAKSRLAISSSAKVDAILNTELTPAFKGDVSVQDALTKAAGEIDGLLAAEK